MNRFLEYFNLDKLKQVFLEITAIHTSILEKKNILDEKLNFLKTIYNELIKQNTKQMFVFCLDSFYFQYKMLNTEMQHICYFISIINNRMYGDYYKLYHIMLKQIKEKGIEVSDLRDNIKNYPQYKDLDTTHDYVVENTAKIHAEIIDVLTKMLDYYLEQDAKIAKYNETTKVGISISNFISTLEYEKSILREHMTLYYNYMDFFHTSQYDHLTSISKKINEFYIKIKDDIIKNQKSMPMESDTESVVSLSPSMQDLEQTSSMFADYPKTPQNSDVSGSSSSSSSGEYQSDEECIKIHLPAPVAETEINRGDNDYEADSETLSTLSTASKQVSYVINVIIDGLDEAKNESPNVHIVDFVEKEIIEEDGGDGDGDGGVPASQNIETDGQDIDDPDDHEDVILGKCVEIKRETISL